MELEEQIKAHKELSLRIGELEEEKKALGEAILIQMQGKTLQIGGFIVRRQSRISIKLSLEQARELNAIKLEETIDKDKIKELFNQGQTMEGVSQSEHIIISTEKP